jgi:hypothetical protein
MVGKNIKYYIKTFVGQKIYRKYKDNVMEYKINDLLVQDCKRFTMYIVSQFFSYNSFLSSIQEWYNLHFNG